jgi:hypothetical protein
MQKIVVVAAMLSLTMTCPAFARDFTDGNALYDVCQKPEGYAWCQGYTQGAVDVYQSMGSSCVPDGVQAPQLRDLVVRWLREHPERRQIAGPFVVARVIGENFPCSQ